MTDDTNIICVFTGSLVDVKYYQERLEEIGISSMFRDDFRSGTIVGIGGVPNSVELFVEIPDEDKAHKCIEDLQKEK